jgi:hypothetical protein
MCSSKLAALIFAGVTVVWGQDRPLDLHSSIRIKFPPDSPVVALDTNTNVGESRATPRGGAMVVDLHMALSLRNVSSQHIRGVTLLVLAQEVTPGGKASVAVPSLDVAPGQAFPVRIDLRLLRPLQNVAGPLVEVSLDGVLFEGFDFYGPNKLNSRRSMTAWEMEAERDRRHFKSVLAAGGPEGLRREMMDSLNRQAQRPRIDVRVSRSGHAVSDAGGPEQIAQFAFLKFPDSPIEPTEGWAEISGNEARAPRIEVRNRSSRPVKYVEIGWIVKDRQGREFLAGSVPAADSDMLLPPGQTGRVLQDTALRFSRNAGQPVSIASMTGFVSQVEFSDGKVWVPNRVSLDNARLLSVLAPSPEEQRLTDMYRTKGMSALIEELRKF